MKVGFVHMGGVKGDGVRNGALGAYLRRQGVEVVDVRLYSETDKPSLSSYLDLANLASLANIWLGRRETSLISDMDWNRRLRQLKRRSIAAWTASVIDRSAGVDLLHAETHTSAYVCALAKQQTGKPFVFDVHGLQVEEMKGRNCPTGIVRFTEKMETVAMQAADYVSVVSPRMRDILSVRHQKPLSQFVILPNGTYVYPKRAQFSKPLRVIFAGNFAPYERVQDFIGMAELLQGPDYEFVLMGDGELRDQLFSQVNQKGLDMVYLFRKIHEKALRIFCDMHVGVAPVTDALNGQAACSMKTRDYATCGLPIITPDVGEWADLIRSYDAGFVTPKSDPTQFAEVLVQLSDQAVWEQKSANAIKMAHEACLWDSMLEPLVGVYESVLSSQRTKRAPR
jgi:glycosyltransferase involved in cell wall biosynthesis